MKISKLKKRLQILLLCDFTVFFWIGTGLRSFNIVCIDEKSILQIVIDNFDKIYAKHET